MLSPKTHNKGKQSKRKKHHNVIPHPTHILHDNDITGFKTGLAGKVQKEYMSHSNLVSSCGLSMNERRKSYDRQTLT